MNAPKIIHINSRDADFYYWSNNKQLTSGFVFTLQQSIIVPDNMDIYLSLHSFECPYSWYIVNINNNELDYTEIDNQHSTQTEKKIIIPFGNYDVISLGKTLENLLNDNSNLINYTVSYIKNQNKYQISINENNRSVIFHFSKNFQTNCNQLLGFSQNDFTITKTSPIISDSVVNLIENNSIYVKTNMSSINSLSSNTGTYTDILGKIAVNCRPNELILYDNNNSFKSLISLSNIRQISISLCNEFNQLIDLNGQHFQLSLLIEYVPRINNVVDLMDTTGRIIDN